MLIDPDNHMDNSHYETVPVTPWRIVRQHSRWMVGLTLACAVVTGIISLLQKPTYRASTYLLLTESKVETTQGTIANYVYYEILRSYEAFITNDAVILKTIEKLGLHRPPYLLTVDEFQKRKIARVEWSKNTRLLEVSAEFTDPRLAAEIVNSFADNAVQLNEELIAQDIRRARALLKVQLDVCSQRLESAREKLNEFNHSSNLSSLQQTLMDKQELNTANQREFSRLLIEKSKVMARREVLLAELKNDKARAFIEKRHRRNPDVFRRQ